MAEENIHYPQIFGKAFMITEPDQTGNAVEEFLYDTSFAPANPLRRKKR
jgi:hypothetical protein